MYFQQGSNVSMRPPLDNPTFTPTKWAVALLILVLWTALLLRCSAATVVFGDPTIGLGGALPFGTTSAGMTAYVGRYQQIYGSSAFPSKSLISQIAFSTDRTTDADVNYVLSIRLGVTTRTPANPGTGFATGATTLFSGAFVAHVTPINGDWDVSIDLPTPFLYDPALGSLLLDVTVNSVSGLPSMRTRHTARGYAENVASIHLGSGSLFVSPGYGQVTQFTVTPVPEPGTAGMLLLGAVLCVRRPARARGVREGHSPKLRCMPETMLNRFHLLLAFSLKCCLAILILGVLAADTFATTIVAGQDRTQDVYPFGLSTTIGWGPPVYHDQYQQIYSSTLFPTAGWITQIAFMDAGLSLTANVSWKFDFFGLGVTARTPPSPGNDFAKGAMDVSLSHVGAHITPTTDFDLLINLPTPFYYDPALGNLLLDLTIYNGQRLGRTAAASNFSVDNATADMGRIYRVNGSVVSAPNEGLVTQFTVNPVPEPTMGALLLLGAALCVPRRVRVPFRSF